MVFANNKANHIFNYQIKLTNEHKTLSNFQIQFTFLKKQLNLHMQMQ